VMRRLLSSLTQVLGGDSAALVILDEGGPVVAATQGATVAPWTRLHPAEFTLRDVHGPQVHSVRPGEMPPFGRLLGNPRSWWAAPATEHGQSFGILLVGASGAHTMTETQGQIAAAIAGQGMTAYENARLFSQVRRMATVDGLTDLFNRSHFVAEADRQVHLAQRSGHPIAAIMVDIDHFKRINDTYGHPVGDEVIRAVAQRLRSAVRETDILGRYGGEEFALLTPQTAESAAVLADRLHQVVSGTPVPTVVGPLRVTISVGLAYRDPGEDTLQPLLTRADGALYQAKYNGRDRVCVAP